VVEAGQKKPLVDAVALLVESQINQREARRGKNKGGKKGGKKVIKGGKNNREEV